MEQQSSKPYVEIVEQPCSRGLRFRYECEGRSAGSVSGVSSTRFHKTSPSIRVRNYTGPVFVVLSCVSKDKPYRPHPFNIVGKAKEIVKGICYFSVEPNHEEICFPNFGIQCVKRRDMFKSLAERERMNIDPFKTGFSRAQSAAIDMTSVRLCFQVFLEGQKGSFKVALDPVVSQPIYDKKSSSELSIRWYSQHSTTVSGDTAMCILCERVSKDDIQVRFFCEETGWESTAVFTAPICHKQVAVIFKTPRYIYQNIEKPVEVKIELRRLSDGETSEPVSFMFLPLDGNDPEGLKNKRRKLNETPRMSLERLLAAQAQKKEEPSEELLRTQFSIMKTEPWGWSSKTNLPAGNGIPVSFECPTMNSYNTNQMNSTSNAISTSLGCPTMNGCNTNQMNPASNATSTSLGCPTMNSCNTNQMNSTSNAISTSLGCPTMNSCNTYQINPASNAISTSLGCPTMNSCNTNQMNSTSLGCPITNSCNTNQMNLVANTVPTSFQWPSMSNYNANQMNLQANAIQTSFQCTTMDNCNCNQMNQINYSMNPATNNTTIDNISNNKFYYNNLQPMQCTTTTMDNQRIDQLIDISTPNDLPVNERVFTPLHSFDFDQTLPDITQDNFLQFLET